MRMRVASEMMRIGLLRHAATDGGFCYVTQRKFRRAIGEEQAVGFLIRVGKLRVTEPGEQIQRIQYGEQTRYVFPLRRTVVAARDQYRWYIGVGTDHSDGCTHGQGLRAPHRAPRTLPQRP